MPKIIWTHYFSTYAIFNPQPVWILIQGWNQGQESHYIQPSNLSSALMLTLHENYTTKSTLTKGIFMGCTVFGRAFPIPLPITFFKALKVGTLTRASIYVKRMRKNDSCPHVAHNGEQEISRVALRINPLRSYLHTTAF